MARRVSATEARIRFGELMRDVVERQEAVVVERNGEPYVVVISAAEYDRLLDAEKDRGGWRELVAAARERVRTDLAGRPLPPPEDILHEVRSPFRCSSTDSAD